MIPSYISRQTALPARIQARERSLTVFSSEDTHFVHVEMLYTPEKACGVSTDSEYVPARCLQRFTCPEDEPMLKLLASIRAGLRVAALCCDRNAPAVLDRNMRFKSRTIYMYAHELRTPRNRSNSSHLTVLHQKLYYSVRSLLPI